MGVPAAAPQAAQSMPSSAQDLSPKCILVVDDEESIRNLLAALLREGGHNVIKAGNATEALACLKSNPVAVLIVDVQLPDMDGITLLQQAIEQERNLLGLVMTGYGNVDVAVRAMKAGAADFISKPFQADLVRLTVTRLMELHRLRQENSVLKNAMIRSGNIRLTRMALTDFGHKEQKHGGTDYQRGVADGEQRASERMAVLRQQEQSVFTAMIERLESTWRTLHTTIEHDVASLAFGIAHKVLRDVVVDKPDLVVAQVRVALSHIQERGLIRICVHPSDLPLLEAARQALTDDSQGAVSFKLEADSAVSRGGCLIHTATRMIDATLETQLLRIGEALRKRESRETH